MEQHWKGQKIVEEHSFELEEKTEVEEEQMMPMDPWDDALVEKKVDTLLLFPQDNKDIDQDKLDIHKDFEIDMDNSSQDGGSHVDWGLGSRKQRGLEYPKRER